MVNMKNLPLDVQQHLKDLDIDGDGTRTQAHARFRLRVLPVGLFHGYTCIYMA